MIDITSRRFKGVKDLLIIRLKGKLISVWAREFSEYFHSTIPKNGLKTLIINLKETTFIDTIGLNVLKEIQDRGLNLALTGVGYNVAVIFGYTNGYETFNVFSDEDGALASLGHLERRRVPRQSISTPVPAKLTCYEAGREQDLNVLITDTSEKGVAGRYTASEIHKPLSLGTKISRITLALPASAILNLSGQVVWTRVSDSEVKFGLIFDKISERTRNKIKQLSFM